MWLCTQGCWSGRGQTTDRRALEDNGGGHATAAAAMGSVPMAMWRRPGEVAGRACGNRQQDVSRHGGQLRASTEPAAHIETQCSQRWPGCMGAGRCHRLTVLPGWPMGHAGTRTDAGLFVRRASCCLPGAWLVSAVIHATACSRQRWHTRAHMHCHRHLARICTGTGTGTGASLQIDDLSMEGLTADCTSGHVTSHVASGRPELERAGLPRPLVTHFDSATAAKLLLQPQAVDAPDPCPLLRPAPLVAD